MATAVEYGKQSPLAGPAPKTPESETVTYAVKFNARSISEAVEKVRNDLGSLNLWRDISPITEKSRLLLGECKPLIETENHFTGLVHRMEHLMDLRFAAQDRRILLIEQGSEEKAQGQHEEIHKKIHSLEEGNRGLNKKIHSLEEGNRGLNKKIHSLGGGIHSLEEDNRGLNKKIHSLEDDIDSLEEDNRGLNDNMRFLMAEKMAEKQESGRKAQWLNDTIHFLEDDNRRLNDRIHSLEKDNRGLNDNMQFLMAEQHKLMKREVIYGVYNAIGHRYNAPRWPTFRWMCRKRDFLRRAFGQSERQINDLLDFLHPEALIAAGSDAAHRFSLDDAMGAVGVNEQPVRDIIDFLAGRYGASATIKDASELLRKDFAKRYQNTLSTLPKVPADEGVRSAAYTPRRQGLRGGRRHR